MTIVEYYRQTDPDYLNKQHQRDFVARMERAQELSPCSVDHSAGMPLISVNGTLVPGPLCHRTSCYPHGKSGRMIGTE